MGGPNEPDKPDKPDEQPDLGEMQDSGGQGDGLLHDPGRLRGDCRLIERWGIKPEWRDACVMKLMGIVVDPTSSRRSLVAAIRALATLDRVNLDTTRIVSGIPETQINIVNQNVMKLAASDEVRAMDLTIPPPCEEDQ